MKLSRPLRERTSIIATCLTLIAALLASSASWAADLVVETAILTVNYRLGAADGNMIASPYIAEMPTGESYKVDSPSIEGFVLEDEEQATVSGNDDKGD